MANTQTRSFVFSLFAVIAALCVSNIALADLVAYWTFNDYTNGTLLSDTTDSSGNGYTVSNVGEEAYRPFISSSNQLYGNHLQRNNATAESKSNCNITAANVYTGNMTISYWGTQPTTNWRNYITLRTDSTGDEFQFQKANNGMVVYKTDRNNGNATSMVGDSSLSLGTAWHHFVVTVDSSTQKARMYIDGSLISETTWTYNEQVTNLTFNGAWNFGKRGSDANLDEVQIYNQSMTAQQVQFLYNNPSLYQATVYQRNVTANGNWSDADWNANGQTGQTFANSSAVQLDATNAPTLTLDQNVTVNSIDFNGSMTVDGSNTITLNGEKRITVANAADTAAISAPITAQYDNSITKTGAGTLKLSGTNTHTGGTTVTGGTLAVTNVNALGTGDVTLNGGTLNTTGVASGSTFANGIAVGENGGTVTAANGTDLSGAYTKFGSLSGSGALTTNGWVQFNGTGGYNGHLTVNSGYTQINPNSVGVIDLTMKSGSHFSLLNAGTLQIGKLNSTADVEIVGSQSGNAYTIEIGVGTTSSDTASFAGYIHCPTTNSKNITVKKVGAGTQTFNRGGYGYASPSGTIKEVIVDGGKMIINASHDVYTAGNTTGFWGNAPITVNSGGTLVYNRSWNTSPNIMLTVNGGTLTINSYEYQNKLTLNSATVNGSSELRAGYNGTGTWTVKGGTTTINNSIVTVKSGNYTTFTINIADGATLDVKKNISGLNKYTGTNLVVKGTGTNGTGTLKLHAAEGVTMSGMGSITYNNINVEMTGNAGWLGNGYYNKSAVTLTNSTLTTSTPHTTNASVFTLDNSTLTFNGKINSYIHEITLKNCSKITGATSVSQFRTGHNWNSKIKTQYVSGTTENVMNTISADIVMHDPSKTMTFDIAAKAPLTFSGRFIPAAPDDYSSNHNNLLVKTGAGVLTLTGDNDLYQPVTISAGKLVLAGNGTLGTSDVTNNATLEFAYTSDKDFANSISGTGAVIKSGSGTLTLTQALGYTGATTVESGTLALSVGGTLYNLSGAGDVNYGANALTLNNSAATTFSGDILGSGAITKTGTGTLTLSHQPEYTGSTTVEQGTMALADGGTLYNLSGGSLDANGQIAVAVALDATGKALTLDNSEMTKFIGSIKAASIEKTGEGTLQIYAAAEGQVNASSFVVSSGRLDMKEYFKGSLAVEAGATLSPGNSIGTLTVDGTFSLDSGATLLMEVGKDEDGNIVTDQLILSGDVSETTFAQGSIINIVLDPASGLQGGDTFTDLIFITTSSESDAESIFDTVKNATISYYFPGFEVKQVGNNILLSGTLDSNAIPEPSTWALLALGAAGLLYWRRRK